MRILLLSYCFPPAAMAEGFVTAKTMGAIGADVDVYCAAASNWAIPVDHSLDDYVSRRFQSVTAFRLPGGSLTMRLSNRIPVVSRLPDTLRFLNARVKHSLPLDVGGGYDVVVTRSPFHSVQLLGLAIKRATPSLPWVASFGDPWAVDPMLPTSGLVERHNRHLETEVFDAADRLVFTSEAALTHSLGPGSSSRRDKAVAIPHGFDPELFASASDLNTRAETRAGDELIVRSVGSFQRERTPKPLLDAVDWLAKEAPKLFSRLRLELIGPMGRGSVTAQMLRHVDQSRVHFRPPVDYVTSLQLMSTADVLVAVDAPNSSSIFLPSKLIDYVGSGRPIVAISPAGPAAQVVLDMGGWVGDPRSPESAGTALAGAMLAAQTYRDKPWGLPARESYHIQAVAALWRDLLADLAGGAV